MAVIHQNTVFDKHRPVYFISVGPQDPDKKLEITNVFPEDQHFDTMRIGAFRTTSYPSGVQPDQIMLSWVSDPSTSMDIQWRCNNTILESKVKYWVSGADDSFSFIWFGDTHKSKLWGDLIQESFQKFPDVAFYSIAGDLVSTGLYRDDWDQLINFSGPVFNYKPLMPVPGNHDNQDGLGAWMYQDMFSLPENGPEYVLPELTYAFNYKNALFLMIDATAPIEHQSKWIEEQLRQSQSLWKFAMFHFPPYNYEEDYSVIREEWCTLFDQYHVDMVMSGHTHNYMRSKPILNEQVVEHVSQGTVYVISVGIPGNHEQMPVEDYAEHRDGKGWLYQHMEINGDRLIYKSLDINGNIKDTFIIEK